MVNIWAEGCPPQMDDKTVPPTAWLEYASADRSYFFNRETRKTTWDIPADYLAWKEGLLKGYLRTTNWRKAADKKEQVYYYDKITKKTQWDVPADVADFEVNLLKFNLKRYGSKKRKVEELSSEANLKVLPAVPLFAQDSVSEGIKKVDDDKIHKIRKVSADSDEIYGSSQHDSGHSLNIPTTSTLIDKRTDIATSDIGKGEAEAKAKLLLNQRDKNGDDNNSESDNEEDYLAADDYIIQATPQYTLDHKVFNLGNDDDINNNVNDYTTDDNINETSVNDDSVHYDDGMVEESRDCSNNSSNIDIERVKSSSDIVIDIDPFTQETDRDQSESQHSQERQQYEIEEHENGHELEVDHVEENDSLPNKNIGKEENYGNFRQDQYGQDHFTQDQYGQDEDWEMDQEREKEMKQLRESIGSANEQERSPDLGYENEQERTPDLGYENEQERTPDLGYENEQEKTPDLGYKSYDEQDRTPNGSEGDGDGGMGNYGEEEDYERQMEIEGDTV